MLPLNVDELAMSVCAICTLIGWDTDVLVQIKIIFIVPLNDVAVPFVSLKAIEELLVKIVPPVVPL